MIILRLDRMMADRKISLKELANCVQITNVHLSRIKNQKVGAITLNLLDALCRELDCTPGDILEYKPDEK